MSATSKQDLEKLESLSILRRFASDVVLADSEDRERPDGAFAKLVLGIAYYALRINVPTATVHRNEDELCKSLNVLYNGLIHGALRRLGASANCLGWTAYPRAFSPEQWRNMYRSSNSELEPARGSLLPNDLSGIDTLRAIEDGTLFIKVREAADKV